MRRAAKIDGNQVEIVSALRAAGCSILHLHQVGHGCPDIAVGHNNKTYLMEIKSGRGMLTPDELTFFETWRGQVIAVYSAEDALSLPAQTRSGADGAEGLALERWRRRVGACPMIDAFCRCGHRLSIADPGDVCMFCREDKPAAPVVPVELARKWLGINANGQKLCRCGAVVAYRSMCQVCSARDVRERRARKEMR